MAGATKLKHAAENDIERGCSGKYIGRAPVQSKSLVTVEIVSTVVQAWFGQAGC
jgi:hypothetical protein